MNHQKTVSFLRKAFVTVAIAAVFAGKIHAQDAGKPAEKVESAMVHVFGQDLFPIYGNLGVMSAELRAATVADKVKKLKKDTFYKPELLKIVGDKHGATAVMYMDKMVVLYVTEEQGRVLGKTTRALAEEYNEIIVAKVEEARSGALLWIMAEQCGLGLLIVVLTFLVIRYINKAHRSSKDLVRRKKEEQHAKKGGTVDAFIDVEKQIKVAHSLIGLARAVLILGVLVLAFWAMLWVFPGTHSLAAKLFGYVLIPAKGIVIAVWNYLPNLIEILVIIFFFRITMKGLRSLAMKIDSKEVKVSNFHADWAMPTYQLIKVVLLMFMLVCIFPLLPNSDSSIFKGVSVFIGVLLSLGSSSIISNIVSGFVITYMRPFRIGDGVRIGSVEGAVIEKNYLVTRVKTSANEIVTIPNSNVMTTSSVNFSKSAAKYGLVVNAVVSIGYDVNWRKVHELLIEAAARTKYLEKEPKPFVVQQALNNNDVSYQINAFTHDLSPGFGAIYTEMRKNIQDVFAEAGIEIASPYTLRAAPPMILPGDYLKAGFDNTAVFPVGMRSEGPDVKK